MIAKRSMLAFFFLSQVGWTHAPHNHQSRDAADLSNDQTQDQMLLDLKHKLQCIASWKVSVAHLQKDVQESSPTVADILAQVLSNFEKGERAANEAMVSRDAQWVQFKYVQTKMFLSIARSELTRASSTALRTEGLETFGRACLNLGREMDDVLKSADDR